MVQYPSRETIQYYKLANNNMDIKIKRDIYTTTQGFKANMNNRQNKENDFTYGNFLHERNKGMGWVQWKNYPIPTSLPTKLQKMKKAFFCV